jgi:hypothetical protein
MGWSYLVEWLATNFCYEVNENMAIGLPEEKRKQHLTDPLRY